MKRINLINTSPLTLFYSFICCLLFPSVLCAQDVRFHIFKEAVVFMAQINAGKPNLSALDTCGSIEGLMLYSSDNNLTGLNKAIEGWMLSDEYTKGDLIGLKRKIDKTLTEGTAKDGSSKAERKIKYHDQYTRFITNINAIIAADSISRTQPPSVIADSIPKKDSTIAIFNVSNTTSNLKSITWLFSLTCFFILISLVAMCISLKKRVKTKTGESQSLTENDVKRLIELATSSEFERINKNIRDVNDKFAKIDFNKGSESFARSEGLSSKTTGKETQEQLLSSVSLNSGEIVVRYAKSSVNGAFNSIDLKTRQNGECVFELHLAENKGILKLSNENGVRQYALNQNPEYYFKQDTCDIKGVLSGEKDISVLDEGEVELSPEGDRWLINKRISLKFS